MEYEKGSIVRKADYPIDKIFLDRWSPRAMSGEEITDKEIFTLFEAARWAPSSNNEQPWRFVYGKRGTPHFDKLFGLLTEKNQSWCKNASALVCAISKKTFTYNSKPIHTHMFSTGSAFENIALQGSLMGLVVHGMGGFSIDNSRIELKIPEDYEVNMMFAIGRPGNKDNLPEELKKGEAPNNRKPVKEFVFEGEFKE